MNTQFDAAASRKRVTDKPERSLVVAQWENVLCHGNGRLNLDLLNFLSEVERSGNKAVIVLSWTSAADVNAVLKQHRLPSFPVMPRAALASAISSMGFERACVVFTDKASELRGANAYVPTIFIEEVRGLSLGTSTQVYAGMIGIPGTFGSPRPV